VFFIDQFTQICTLSIFRDYGTPKPLQQENHQIRGIALSEYVYT
jgi:hypothetical protein